MADVDFCGQENVDNPGFDSDNHDKFGNQDKICKQGLTNPLSGCPGQVKMFAGQVKYFLTCPEKCIRYIGKTEEI